MKTCSKCGFVGEDELFRENRSQCKKCHNENRKEWTKNNPEKQREKERQWRAKNPAKVKEKAIKWRENNPEKYIEHIENSGEWAKNNPDRHSENGRLWRKNNLDKAKEIDRIWRENNVEKVKVTKKRFFITPKGKQTISRQNAKRRCLGHEPLNEWFKGSEAHHLRYSKTTDTQDNNVTLYAPRKLHRSIIHNGNTGKNMKTINVLLLEWYLNNVSVEERNKKAVDLYLKYCMLPEPIWTIPKLST
jgi:hypothetical protein